MWGEIFAVLIASLTISLLIFWLRHVASIERSILNPILLESALDSDLRERMQRIRGHEEWSFYQRKKAAYSLVKEAHERYQRAGVPGDEQPCSFHNLR
jgi:hypothetical protein